MHRAHPLSIPILIAACSSAAFLPWQARAQDNQYWTQQQGARATLMGGAATAGTDDQSVLFYNPAAAGHVQSTGITASANFVYGQWFTVQDLEGLGFDARDHETNLAPRLLVGSFDPKKGSRWRISFGYVCNLFSRFEVEQASTNHLERDAHQPGTEMMTSLVNIITTTRDDLVGMGTSYSLNAKSSFGFSLFGSSFVQRYLRTFDLGLYGDPLQNDTVPTLAGFLSTERADIYNLGFLAKLAYFHKGPRAQWGLVLTLPRLSTAFLTGEMYQASTITRAEGSVEKHLLVGSELDTRFDTPWMLDAGMEMRVGTSVLAFRAGYATEVAAYDRMALQKQEDLTQGALPPTDGTLRRVRSASIHVLNGAIGAQFRLSDAADLLAGARTDLNHLDRTQMDPPTDLVGTFSYWDLYHLSCGVAVHSKRVKLTTGLVYSFGYDTSTPDDFSAVSDFFQVDGPITFQSTFHQVGLTFGFSYFVLGEEDAAPITP